MLLGLSDDQTIVCLLFFVALGVATLWGMFHPIQENRMRLR
jgi:hypothetical protein